MTSNEPRRLYRSKKNRILAGVCGGIAEYSNMDPNIVRLVVIVISLLPGPSIIFYLLAWILIPEEA